MKIASPLKVALAAGLLTAPVVTNAQISDVARWGYSLTCNYLAISSISGFAEDLNEAQEQGWRGEELLKESDFDLEKERVKFLGCLVASKINRAVFRRESSHWSTELVDSPAWDTLGTVGNAAFAGHAVLYGYALWQREALAMVREVRGTVGDRFQSTEELLGRMTGIVADVASSEHDYIAAMNGVSIGKMANYLSSSALSNIANGLPVGEQDAEVASNLASVLVRHLPELFNEHTVAVGSAGEFDMSASQDILDTLNELTAGSPTLPVELAMPEKQRDSLEAVFNSSELLSVIAGQEIDNDAELLKLVERLKSDFPELLDGLDANDGVTGIEQTDALTIFDNAVSSKYPDLPETAEFLATFLIAGEVLVTTAVSGDHWDTTNSNYRVLEHCSKDAYQRRQPTPLVRALMQSLLDGSAIFRKIEQEDKEKLGEAFAMAMAEAPVLGSLSTRYMLGHTPDIGFLANQPRAGQKQALEVLLECIEMNYPFAMEYETQPLVHDLLAMLPGSTQVNMDPADELWLAIGEGVVTNVDAAPLDWEAVDRWFSDHEE